MGTIREIDAKTIEDTVYELALEAGYQLPKDVKDALEEWSIKEESPIGKGVLQDILKNISIATEGEFPLCQDTGLAILFIDIGQDVHIYGSGLTESVNKGIERAYKDGFLRKSTCHPFTRANYGNNLPPVIHTSIVPGDKIKIIFDAKGGGSESMSKVEMLKPADGKDGMMNKVVEWVESAGPNPCPPIIVGIGLGSDFERSAILAKKATIMNIGERNPDSDLAEVEEELLHRINNLGIGPAGLGGRCTALDVHVIMETCHIATFPMAINIQCWVCRHKEAII